MEEGYWEEEELVKRRTGEVRPLTPSTAVESSEDVAPAEVGQDLSLATGRLGCCSSKLAITSVALDRCGGRMAVAGWLICLARICLSGRLKGSTKWGSRSGVTSTA